MAGVKGRSGGARPGAGRKPKAVIEGREVQAHGGELKRQKAVPVPQEPTDMLTLLQNVALGLTDATSLQVRAAIAAVQYTHSKKGEGGKNKDAADRAKAAAGGKFGVRQGPRLVANNK
ncbi:hypothetical protein [Acidovorax sp.]|uniref:hypothetical protein n=1 Tax=Acidovorax sp. TaxID=1872122 RepID=UPI0025C2FA7B|nr:hypothetical protein [Acidovorax sp.]MBL7090825.1 hypothetical protein [Acidovorax sp.]